MNREMLAATLAEFAAQGKEGLAITVVKDGKIFGVDIHPDWHKDFKKYGFEMFAKMALEPAFYHLDVMMEEPFYPAVEEQHG